MRARSAAHLLPLFLPLWLLGTAAALCLPGAPVRAEPWAYVNDIRLKNDIETLVEYGILRGPMNTWPIPWKGISRSLGNLERAYPPHVEAAIARVRERMPQPDERGFGIAAEVHGTNEVQLVRDFDGGARGEFDGAVALDKHWNRFYGRVNLGYRSDPDDDNFNLDGSYGAVALGNWMLYGGTVENWWGPGWDTALILSNNARPFPMVGITRMDPKPFDWKWLRWVGPWTFRAFGGRLGDDRFIPNPWLVGWKVDFAPTPWLTLGLTRLTQFCGETRPCDSETIFDALNPVPNQSNVSGTKREPEQGDPSNQQAAYIIKFHGTWGDVGWSLYTEQAAEDQAEDMIALYGVTFTGHTDRFGGGQWRFVGEASDTLDDRIAINNGGTDEPFSSIYRNGIYRDGTIYRDRTIGGTLDFDALLVTGRLAFTQANGRYFSLVYRWADINPRNNDLFREHLVSRNHERINLIEAEAKLPTRFGEFDIIASFADDQPNTPGRSDAQGRVEVGWRLKF